MNAEIITVTIALPAPAGQVARLLRAIERAFPGATLHAIEGGWAIEIAQPKYPSPTWPLENQS